MSVESNTIVPIQSSKLPRTLESPIQATVNPIGECGLSSWKISSPSRMECAAREGLAACRSAAAEDGQTKLEPTT